MARVLTPHPESPPPPAPRAEPPSSDQGNPPVGSLSSRGSSAPRVSLVVSSDESEHSPRSRRTSRRGSEASGRLAVEEAHRRLSVASQVAADLRRLSAAHGLATDDEIPGPVAQTSWGAHSAGDMPGRSEGASWLPEAARRALGKNGEEGAADCPRWNRRRLSELLEDPALPSDARQRLRLARRGSNPSDAVVAAAELVLEDPTLPAGLRDRLVAAVPAAGEAIDEQRLFCEVGGDDAVLGIMAASGLAHQSPADTAPDAEVPAQPLSSRALPGRLGGAQARASQGPEEGGGHAAITDTALEDDAFIVGPQGRACFVLGPENALRVAVYRFIFSAPVTHFLTLLIVVNTATMLTVDPQELNGARPVSDTTEGFLVLDDAATCTFMAEYALKMVALGVWRGPHTLFGRPAGKWFLADFLTVLVSFVFFVFGMGSSGMVMLRAFRAVRPLRSLRAFGGIRAILDSLLKALPLLGDSVALLCFLIFLYGVIGLEFYSGVLERRCAVCPDWDAGCATNLSRWVEAEPPLYCGKADAARSFTCPDHMACLTFPGNRFPYQHASFDNIAGAALIIFHVTTLATWSEIMYVYMDADQPVVAVVYFFSMVIFISFIVINLFIAVINTVFSQIRAEQHGQQALSGDIGDNQIAQALAFFGKGVVRTGSQVIAGAEQGAGLLIAGVTPVQVQETVGRMWKTSLLQLQAKVYTIVWSKVFEIGVYVAIMCNIGLQASAYRGMSEDHSHVLRVSEHVFAAIFLGEAILRLLSYRRPWDYVREPWNVFDAVLVVLSYVSLYAMETNVTFLRSFRVFRIVRLLRSKHTRGLRDLIESALQSIGGVANLAIFVTFSLVIFAGLGKQLLGGQLSTEQRGAFRHSFDSLGDALVTLFVIMTGDSWFVSMYHLMDREKGVGMWVVAFYIAFYVWAVWVLLSLFTAVILENFSHPEEGEREKLEEAQEMQRRREDMLAAEELRLMKEAKDAAASAAARPGPPPALPPAAAAGDDVVRDPREVSMVAADPPFSAVCNEDDYAREGGEAPQPSQQPQPPAADGQPAPAAGERRCSTPHAAALAAPAVCGPRSRRRSSAATSAVSSAPPQLPPSPPPPPPLPPVLPEQDHGRCPAGGAPAAHTLAGCGSRRTSLALPEAGPEGLELGRRGSAVSAASAALPHAPTYGEERESVAGDEEERGLATFRFASAASLPGSPRARRRSGLDSYQGFAQSRRALRLKERDRSRRLSLGCSDGLDATLLVDRAEDACAKHEQAQWLEQLGLSTTMRPEEPQDVLEWLQQVSPPRTKTDHRIGCAAASLAAIGPDPTQLYSLYLFAPTNTFRRACRAVCDHPFFEAFIGVLISAVIIIMAVSASINPPEAFEHEKSGSAAIDLVDEIISWMFLAEVLVKVVAYGFWVPSDSAYLRNPWNRLDFVLVLLMFVAPAAKGLRVVRTLRPLRLVRRAKRMRVIMRALWRSVPTMVNVFITSLFVVFIFGLMGLELFKAKLDYCTDRDMGREHCVGNFVNRKGVLTPRRWVNPVMNFDDLPQATYTLFQIASLNSWSAVMYSAMDITSVDQAPQRNASAQNATFFVCFVLVGTFFIVNMFIGVIIVSINREENVDLLTEDQRNWLELRKQLLHIKPLLHRKRPEGTGGFVSCRRLAYDITESVPFALVIALSILGNMIIAAMRHHGESEDITYAAEVATFLFLGVFAVEAGLKILALGWLYFANSWNRFDFFLVTGNLVMTVALELSSNLSNITLLVYLTRILRIMRVFRLVKRTKGVRFLLATLLRSLNSVLNAFLVLVLLLIIYGLVGVDMFANVRYQKLLHRNANFRSFLSAFLVLFRFITLDGWNDVMWELTVQPPQCTRNDEMDDCGPAPWLVRAYFTSFFLLGSCVVYNLLIGIVIDEFAICYSTRYFSIKPPHIDDFLRSWQVEDVHNRGALPRWRVLRLNKELYQHGNALGLAEKSPLRQLLIFHIEMLEHWAAGQEHNCLDNRALSELNIDPGLRTTVDAPLRFTAVLLILAKLQVPDSALTDHELLLRVRLKQRAEVHAARAKVRGMLLGYVAKRRLEKQHSPENLQILSGLRKAFYACAEKNRAAGGAPKAVEKGRALDSPGRQEFDADLIDHEYSASTGTGRAVRRPRLVLVLLRTVNE